MGNTGDRVWARSPTARIRKARDWHWVTTGYLRQHGVNTPVYRSDSWEVDWTKRNIKLVWARNQASKMPTARNWHWVDFHTLERAGVGWKPARVKQGRFVNSHGYVTLTRPGLTDEDIALAQKAGLFRGARRANLLEHKLVALKKYGELPAGTVVRHINGVKTDNRPENLVLGTTQENTRDHDTARVQAMYWRERCEAAEGVLLQICSVAAVQPRLLI